MWKSFNIKNYSIALYLTLFEDALIDSMFIAKSILDSNISLNFGDTMWMGLKNWWLLGFTRRPPQTRLLYMEWGFNENN